MMSSPQGVRNLVLILLCTLLWCSSAIAQIQNRTTEPNANRSLKDRVAEFQRKLSARFTGQRSQTNQSSNSNNGIDGSRRPANQHYTPPFRDLRTGRNNSSYDSARDDAWIEAQHLKSEKNMVRQAKLQEPGVESLPLPTDNRSAGSPSLGAVSSQPIRQLNGPPGTQYDSAQRDSAAYPPMENDRSFSLPQFDQSTSAGNSRSTQVQTSNFPQDNGNGPQDGYSVFERNPPPSYQQSAPMGSGMPQDTRASDYTRQQPNSADQRSSTQARSPQNYQQRPDTPPVSQSPRSTTQYQQMQPNNAQPYGQHDWSSRQLTATERALKLREDNDELLYKIQAMTKLNGQLREQLRIKSNEDQKMREAIRAANGLLDEAMQENQQLKARIIALENAAKQKAFETERILQTLQTDLDQLLMNQMLKDKK